MEGKIVQWDVSKTPWPLEDESVDVVVTSPPYWGLRDYGKEAITIWGGEAGCKHEWGDTKSIKRMPQQDHSGYKRLSTRGVQEYSKVVGIELKQGSFCHCGAWRGGLGLEPHPDLYITHIVEVCHEVLRVLKKEGSFYLNIGDTYFGGGQGGSDYGGKEFIPSNHYGHIKLKPNGEWLQPKQLLGIPFRVMAALQDDGWILRNIIPWVKPNAMPSSVKDRRNNIWEPVFHFTKSRKYEFDLDNIREPHKESSISRCQPHQAPIGYTEENNPDAVKRHLNLLHPPEKYLHPKGKNPGDILILNTKGSPEAHYSVFPEELVEKLLLPHNGVAFDPFAGRGTVGKVAKRLEMDYILFDISEANLEIARRYIQRSDAGNYRKLEQRRNKPKVTEEGIQKELMEESFAK